MKKLAGISAVISAAFAYIYWDRRKKAKKPAPLLGVVNPKKEMFE